MLQWAHSSGAPGRLVVAASLAFALLGPLPGQNRTPSRRAGNSQTVNVTGKVPAATRLRIEAGGPVTFEGGTSGDISYTVGATLRAAAESDLRARLEREGVRATSRDGWTVLSTAPGTTLSIKAPRLAEVVINSIAGPVVANGVDGALRVHSGGGEISVDRIKGEARLVTGGGEIRVGTVEGPLECLTGAGRITVASARSRSTLETNGGDIIATELRGPATLQTAAGTVRVTKAEGTVTAITGGGQIVVDEAGGVVTARTLAGPVRVGRAQGVRCVSGNGGVHLENIQGSMRVSTSWGNIVANLLAATEADSVLATGNGDITVAIPSNVGVTIRAENDMADTLRRIVSEFPGLSVRVAGTRVVAEGAVNGGGPVLRISDTGGTIYIKRQNRGSR